MAGASRLSPACRAWEPPRSRSSGSNWAARRRQPSSGHWGHRERSLASAPVCPARPGTRRHRSKRAGPTPDGAQSSMTRGPGLAPPSAARALGSPWLRAVGLALAALPAPRALRRAASTARRLGPSAQRAQRPERPPGGADPPSAGSQRPCRGRSGRKSALGAGRWRSAARQMDTRRRDLQGSSGDAGNRESPGVCAARMQTLALPASLSNKLMSGLCLTGTDWRDGAGPLLGPPRAACGWKMDSYSWLPRDRWPCTRRKISVTGVRGMGG